MVGNFPVGYQKFLEGFGRFQKWAHLTCGVHMDQRDGAAAHMGWPHQPQRPMRLEVGRPTLTLGGALGAKATPLAAGPRRWGGGTLGLLFKEGQVQEVPPTHPPKPPPPPAPPSPFSPAAA